jgi:Glutamine synthetase adenylyltransferase
MREQSVSARLRKAGFTQVAKAEQLLEECARAGVAAPRIEAFAQAPDPDQCLLLLTRLVEACPEGRQLRDLLEGPACRRLLAVLGLSKALGDFLVAHPEALSSLETRSPGEAIELEDFTEEAEKRGALTAVEASGSRRPVAKSGGAERVNALRRWYYGRILAIAACDLTCSDPLEAMPAVSAAISAVVGGALEAALAIARAQTPGSECVDLTIVAMGKTGAGEVNYVSDVDVVYVARPARDSDPDVSPANGDFEDSEEAVEIASKLACAAAHIVSAPSAEPALWVLDANLRPEGKDGPLVRTLESHVAYYKRWAKGWEFQALLKARPIAGDRDLGEEYMAALWPMVWEAAGHENFVEDSRAMRRRVENHVPAREANRQLKLGKGGLRDVEFTVQLLQLVHGRTDQALRVRSTVDGLRLLRDGSYVSRADAEKLDRDYRILRVLEHRVQLRRLRRTHLLPTGADDLRTLARAMSLPGIAGADDLERLWQGTRREVRALHREIYYRPLLPEAARLSPDDIALSEGPAKARLEAIGYRDAAAALRHIRALTGGISRGAAIQRQLLPVMLGWFAHGPDPDAGLLAFRVLSERMGRTSWFLRSLRDGGAAAEKLCTLLSTSRYVAKELPAIAGSVSWLLDEEGLVPRGRKELEGELASMISRRFDPKEIARAGRYLRRRELLRIAMGQVLRTIDPVSSRAAISSAADIAVEAALRAAVPAACEKLGMERPLSSYAVIALGRMGGREMGYASDADVVFIHEPFDDAAPAEAAKLANEVASQVTRLLGDLDSEPPLVVDSDLRPEGRRGSLARSIDSYAEYLRRWAHTWELQALLRARPCAGDIATGKRFIEMIDAFRYPEGGLDQEHIRQIRTMKARVETERIPSGVSANRHVKLGRGGLADVEWTAQLLQLRHAWNHPELRTVSTLEALRGAAKAGLISADEERRLTRSWELASTLRDINVLASGRTSGGRIDVLSHEVRDLAAVAALMGRDAAAKHDIEEEYMRSARRARADVEKIFFGMEPRN